LTAPKTYAVSLYRVRQITLMLRLPKAFPDAFCDRLKTATALYVTYATSYELAPKGQLTNLLEDWVARSGVVRKRIWKTPAAATPKPRSRMTLAAIQKQYFRRQARLYEPLGGHKRHLMASAALGLSVALDLCQYALQELKEDRRGSHARHLWEVWVAMLIAEFRAAKWNPVVSLKPKLKIAPKFVDFIRALEETLPDAALKRQYAPVVFRRRLKRAAMLAHGQAPDVMVSLMKFWGSYDRTKRSRNRQLNRLLKRAERLYPLRPLYKQRAVSVSTSPAQYSV
jgi:hypothetical protein